MEPCESPVCARALEPKVGGANANRSAQAQYRNATVLYHAAQLPFAELTYLRRLPYGQKAPIVSRTGGSLCIGWSRRLHWADIPANSIAAGLLTPGLRD
jgi:hypothetical protein